MPRETTSRCDQRDENSSRTVVRDLLSVERQVDLIAKLISDVSRMSETQRTFAAQYRNDIEHEEIQHRTRERYAATMNESATNFGEQRENSLFIEASCRVHEGAVDR